MYVFEPGGITWQYAGPRFRKNVYIRAMQLLRPPNLHYSYIQLEHGFRKRYLTFPLLWTQGRQLNDAKSHDIIRFTSKSQSLKLHVPTNLKPSCISTLSKLHLLLLLLIFVLYYCVNHHVCLFSIIYRFYKFHSILVIVEVEGIYKDKSD